MYTKQRLGEGTGEQFPEEIYTPLACLVPLQAIKDWPLTEFNDRPRHLGCTSEIDAPELNWGSPESRRRATAPRQPTSSS